MFSFFNRIFFLFMLSCIPAAAIGQAYGNRAGEYVGELMSGDLESSVVAVLALTCDGDTIVSVNPNTLMLPASDMKLITTGLALDRLGADFTFRTDIGYTGEIRDSVLVGNIYIAGGGDPTLASDNCIAAALPELFGEWLGFIRNAGIGKIEGYVIGDGRYFGEDMPEDPSWQWDDCGTYYGAGISGLSFYENRQDFTVTPGKAPGDPVRIEEDFPECPWMKYTSECTTGPVGTGDKLYYYTSDLAPAGEMRGTLAAGMSAKILECSNKFPAYTCASYFTDWLRHNGIKCTEGAADTGFFSPEGGVAGQKDITVLGSTESPSLAAIARMTNHESNNVYAETLFHALGRDVCGSGSHENSRLAAEQLLSGMGLDARAVKIKDGSGLSRQDFLSAGFICAFLKAMEKSPEFGSYLCSLPSPGDKGTMEPVMAGYDLSLKSRIKLKSGSMTGVKCFSGYIFPSSLPAEHTSEHLSGCGGPAVFSIMINNSPLSQYRLQKIIDRLIFLISAGNP